MKTSRGERKTIVLAGRRNEGKSSLINAITGQELSIVSEVAGTTTDPVRKAYELLPYGPVTFTDTAGFDDVGELGQKRIEKTLKCLENADFVLLVVTADHWDLEKEILALLKEKKIPYLIVVNKCDILPPSPDFLKSEGESYISVSAATGAGISALRNKIIEKLGEGNREKGLLSDIAGDGELILLVVPIDLAAPKGRLILPQVQTIREILDLDSWVMVVKERELEAAMACLKAPPALVITDSQAVLKVAGDIPEDQPLTTFSILFARYKGELEVLVRGAEAIDRLVNGDKVLIAEACSHHVQADDIGRVKIPRWISQYTGACLAFDVCAGLTFPDNVNQYSLIVLCGGCMITPVEMKNRIQAAVDASVPVTNYGICISKVQGLLKRTTEIFPELSR